MINIQDSLNSSFWGVLRGLAVQPVVFPLGAIKVHQQLSKEPQNAASIAKKLYQEGGFRRFYLGISPELVKVSTKQFWCWPMITGVPRFLNRFRLNDIEKQLITGLLVSTTDALIATSLESRKVNTISSGKSQKLSFKVYKEGWQGFGIHWTKLSVSWTAFLTAQQYLRSRAKSPTETTLPLRKLAVIGTQVAIFVTVISAPLDLATTRKLVKNEKVSLSRHLFRGSPLNGLALIIQNITSVILLDWLQQH